MSLPIFRLHCEEIVLSCKSQYARHSEADFPAGGSTPPNAFNSPPQKKSLSRGPPELQRKVTLLPFIVNVRNPVEPKKHGNVFRKGCSAAGLRRDGATHHLSAPIPLCRVMETA